MCGGGAYTPELSQKLVYWEYYRREDYTVYTPDRTAVLSVLRWEYTTLIEAGVFSVLRGGEYTPLIKAGVLSVLGGEYTPLIKAGVLSVLGRGFAPLI